MASVPTLTATENGPVAKRKTIWIFGRNWDLFVSLAWVPVFVVAHVLVNLPGATGASLLRQGIVLALLISFLHQPLTFGLVYGDPAQFRLHRRLFVIAPVVAVGVAVGAAAANLSIVVPIAAIWNLQHTLQQRYGLQRIYAGRSGYGSARLDRAFSYVPMIAVLGAVAAAPSTAALASRSGLDPMNAGAVHLLITLRPAALAVAIVAGVATLCVLAATARQEIAAGTSANPAKRLYQASSLALLASIVIDPAAGFIAYVSAHAIEYAVVVDRTAKRRYSATTTATAAAGADRAPFSILAWLARTALGRVAFFAVIAVAALFTHEDIHGVPLNAIVYSVGALHFTYDAVIWKLRKPVVAKDFSIPARRPELATG